MVIVEGEANVTRDGTQIAVLGPGSFFGEMSLLDGRPRDSDHARSDAVLMLTTDAFNRALATMPSVDRKMLAVLAARLRDMEAKYLPAPGRTGLGPGGTG